MKEMESHGLVARNLKEAETTYFFMNSLIKDVIYGQMLFSQRRQIHHTVARMYLKYYADNTAYHPILAYHFKQAEEDEKALYFYTKAGSLSLVSYANQEAVTFFNEAINLIQKLRSTRSVEDLTIERKLGQAYFNLGQYRKAEQQFKKILDLLGLPMVSMEDRKKSMKKRLFLNGKKGENVTSTGANSEKQMKLQETVTALLSVAKISLYTCNRDLMTDCATLALSASENSNAGPSLEGEVLAINSVCAGLNLDYVGAQNYISRSKKITERQIDVLAAVELMNGLYHMGVAEWSKAEESFKIAIETVLPQTVGGDPKTYEQCTIHLGTVQYLKGDIKLVTLLFPAIFLI